MDRRTGRPLIRLPGCYRALMSNPYQKEDGWYYHDEAQAWEFGPFTTREEAEEKLLEYAKSLDEPPPEAAQDGR